MKRIVLLWAVLAVGCTRSAFDSQQQEGGLSVSTAGSDWQAYVASEAGLIEEPLPVGKATESRFQPKDEIGIFLYSGSLAYQSTNMRYFTQDGTPDGSTTAPKWLAGDAMGGRLAAGTTYYGVAYYPHQAGATDASAVPHTVAADQSAAEGKQATALERSDFLWAAPVKVVDPTSSPAVGLTFAHAMTKMVINLDVPMVIDGYAVSKANSISIRSIFRSCTVDLRTGAVANPGDEGDVTPRLLSGDLLPGKRSVWEAVVVPQDLDVNHALISIKCQTSAGEKTVNYMPPGAGLMLSGGTKVTFMLTSSADLAITSELDLFTGEAETLPLKVKTTNGTAWTLTSSQPSWLTLSTGSTGTFGTSISGTGTGSDQTVYVKTVANTGAAAISRDAVLTLSATLSGQARSVTYRAVQNYSVPVTGFPETYVWMAGCQYELPKVKGNSKWYIKAASLPSSVKFSTRNVSWSDLQAEDVVDVVSLTNTGTKKGFEVLGNYFNTGGSLYVVTDPTASPKFDVLCNGVTVTIDARTVQVGNVRWARGNLVAVGNIAGPVAPNTNGAKVKIGDLLDYGMHFHFGSLIGWKGGNENSGGSGQGMPSVTSPMSLSSVSAWTTDNQNSTFSWTNDAMVWPSVFTDGPTGVSSTWPYHPGANKYYFGLNTVGMWDQAGKNLSDFPGFTAGTLVGPACAVGDPCRYYLGSQWRTPTAVDWGNLGNNRYPSGVVGDATSWVAVNLDWGDNALRPSAPSANIYASRWLDPVALTSLAFNITLNMRYRLQDAVNAVHFIGGGRRSFGYGLPGGFRQAYNASPYAMSQTIYNDLSRFAMASNSFSVTIHGSHNRCDAIPVRCVIDVQ